MVIIEVFPGQTIGRRRFGQWVFELLRQFLSTAHSHRTTTRNGAETFTVTKISTITPLKAPIPIAETLQETLTIAQIAFAFSHVDPSIRLSVSKSGFGRNIGQ